MKKQKRNIRTLAEKSGYKPAMLSHIVNVRRTPSLAGAIRLFKASGIPIEVWASNDIVKIRRELAKWKAGRKTSSVS